MYVVCVCTHTMHIWGICVSSMLNVWAKVLYTIVGDDYYFVWIKAQRISEYDHTCLKCTCIPIGFHEHIDLHHVLLHFTCTPQLGYDPLPASATSSWCRLVRDATKKFVMPRSVLAMTVLLVCESRHPVRVCVKSCTHKTHLGVCALSHAQISRKDTGLCTYIVYI